MKSETQTRLNKFIDKLIKTYGESSDNFVVISYRQILDVYESRTDKDDFPFHGYITRDEKFKVGRGKFFVCKIEQLAKLKAKYLQTVNNNEQNKQARMLPKEVRNSPTKLFKEIFSDDDIPDLRHTEDFVSQRDIDEMFGDDINDILSDIRKTY